MSNANSIKMQFAVATLLVFDAKAHGFFDQINGEAVNNRAVVFSDPAAIKG